MTQFSSRVEQVSISGIREVFEAAGEDAINLGLGQPDFPTPSHARRAAVEAIEAARRALSGAGKSGWPSPRLMASAPAASNTSRMPLMDTCSTREENSVIPV